MFDLTANAPLDEAEYEVTFQDGSPSGWFIRFAGPGHEKTRALNERLARADNERRASAKPQSAARKAALEPESTEAQMRSIAEALAGRILGWRGFGDNGVEIGFSEEMAVRVFMDPKWSFVVGQCLDFIADRVSFMKPSANG